MPRTGQQAFSESNNKQVLKLTHLTPCEPSQSLIKIWTGATGFEPLLRTPATHTADSVGLLLTSNPANAHPEKQQMVATALGYPSAMMENRWNFQLQALSDAAPTARGI